MSTKNTTIRLSEADYKKVTEYGGSFSGTVEKIVRGFLSLHKYTARELKGRFTRQEWIAMIDAQNGTMLVEDYQPNLGVFIAHMEDFESLESGLSRHGANPEAFFEKVKHLTASQIFFLQVEISKFWETENRDLEKFIKTYTND